MAATRLPLGKLPPAMLAELLSGAPVDDPRIVQGPGIGLDCAVIEAGAELLVLKSDPVTFAIDQLGYYLVQVNTNDVVTTGALPRWLLVTLLLPEGRTTQELAATIMVQVYATCRSMGIAVVGGHTEVTAGLDRPVAVGALIGEVPREKLVTPKGAEVGNKVLLTKGVPIEGAALLAREFPKRLMGTLSDDEIQRARRYLFDPGIGIFRDARTALDAGRITAMHDPTEGGLVTALWELAEASGKALEVDASAVPVPGLAKRVCGAFGIDPFSTIASGALLLTAPADQASAIRTRLQKQGIACADIGRVLPGPPAVLRIVDGHTEPWDPPQADGITLAYAYSSTAPS